MSKITGDGTYFSNVVSNLQVAETKESCIKAAIQEAEPTIFWSREKLMDYFNNYKPKDGHKNNRPAKFGCCHILIK